jgi:hypothetical protein
MVVQLVIPPVGRLRQEGCKFETCLGYIARPQLKKTNKQKNLCLPKNQKNILADFLNISTNIPCLHRKLKLAVHLHSFKIDF